MTTMQNAFKATNKISWARTAIAERITNQLRIIDMMICHAYDHAQYSRVEILENKKQELINY